MLLHVDGLDAKWQNGVASPYAGEMGWHEVEDAELHVPLIFQRVRTGSPGHLLFFKSFLMRQDQLCQLKKFSLSDIDFKGLLSERWNSSIL